MSWNIVGTGNEFEAREDWRSLVWVDECFMSNRHIGEVAMTPMQAKNFSAVFRFFFAGTHTQYGNVTIMLCKKLCDDCNVGEYLQIIPNQ